MGWRKRKKQEPRREESPERSGSVADPALDLVGDLLRGMGEHVVDLGDVSPEAVRETFEAWARHVLVGAPIPGQPDRRVAIPLAHRSWSGARRFAQTVQGCTYTDLPISRYRVWCLEVLRRELRALPVEGRSAVRSLLGGGEGDAAVLWQEEEVARSDYDPEGRAPFNRAINVYAAGVPR